MYRSLKTLLGTCVFRRVCKAKGGPFLEGFTRCIQILLTVVLLLLTDYALTYYMGGLRVSAAIYLWYFK